jgi:hypothetical protein
LEQNISAGTKSNSVTKTFPTSHGTITSIKMFTKLRIFSYPELNKSSPYPRTLVHTVQFNIITYSTNQCCNCSPCIILGPKFCMHFLIVTDGTPVTIKLIIWKNVRISAKIMNIAVNHLGLMVRLKRAMLWILDTLIFLKSE